MNTELSVSNFSRYFIFHPRSISLSERNQYAALIVSIVIGILTAGLFHLVVAIGFYDRNFKLKTDNDKRIDQIRQSALPSSIVTHKKSSAPPVAILLNNTELQKKCVPEKTFHEAILEWNSKRLAEWQKYSKAERFEIITEKLSKLSTQKKAELETRVSWHYRTSSIEKIDDYLSDLIPTLKTEDLNDPNAVIPCIPYIMNFVVPGSAALKKMLELKLEHFTFPHQINAAHPEFIDAALMKKQGVELTPSEYEMAKEYFDTRLHNLNREIGLKERLKEDDTLEQVEQLPLEVLTKPLTNTVLKACLLTERELAELTVEQLKAASDEECAIINKMFFTNPKRLALKGVFANPSHEWLTSELAEINAENFTEARVACLSFLNGRQLQMLLPQMPNRLFTFLGEENISGVDGGVLVQYFDKLFVLNGNSIQESLTRNRLSRLTADQIHHLNRQLTVEHLRFLTKRQIKDLDLARFTQTQQDVLQFKSNFIRI